MMDNPSYDGFSDGRRRRRPHHRMKPFVLVILLLLAVVGVAVALAVILTGKLKFRCRGKQPFAI